MNKVSKIEIDRIKQGCNCKKIVGQSRSYITNECKSCMHKKGKSFIREKIDDYEFKKQYEENKARIKFEFHQMRINLILKGPTQLKLNWFQKLIYM